MQKELVIVSVGETLHCSMNKSSLIKHVQDQDHRKLLCKVFDWCLKWIFNIWWNDIQLNLKFLYGLDLIKDYSYSM